MNRLRGAAKKKPKTKAGNKRWDSVQLHPLKFQYFSLMFWTSWLWLNNSWLTPVVIDFDESIAIILKLQASFVSMTSKRTSTQISRDSYRFDFHCAFKMQLVSTVLPSALTYTILQTIALNLWSFLGFSLRNIRELSLLESTGELVYNDDHILEGAL